MNAIPVIDLKKIVTGSGLTEKEFRNVSNQIQKALHEVGFMYIVNHGVSSKIVESAFQQSESFFKLEENIKEKYRKNPIITNHGWIQPGQELLNANSVYEIREAFDFVNTKPAEILECPNFYPIMAQMKNECQNLMRILLKLIAMALKLEDNNFFLNCCTHLDNPNVSNECDLRVIYYPPVPQTTEIPEGSVRCSEHTDYEMLTLLFQDDVGGLQIKNAEGCWIPATPIPGAILINTGDLLERWTNSYFPATMHRVIIPKPEIQQRIPRYSFAYFFAPDDSTIISPLKTEVVNLMDNRQVQPTVTAYEHIMQKVKQAYQY